MRPARFILGIVIAAGVAGMYATGFFYTSQVAVIGSFVVGFLALVLSYPLGISGGFSWRLLLVSTVIGSALLAAMTANAATRAQGVLAAEFSRIVSEPGWLQTALPTWALLIGGVLIVGLMLPRKKRMAA